MKARAQAYLRKAEEFARMAEAASEPETQRNYRGLAESYAQLARKVMALCGLDLAEADAFGARAPQPAVRSGDQATRGS